MNGVEDVIRRSEVMAVVRALRSNYTPQIGESLDYFIEVPDGTGTYARVLGQSQKSYRLEVEKWHLDAAKLILSAENDTKPR